MTLVCPSIILTSTSSLLGWLCWLVGKRAGAFTFRFVLAPLSLTDTPIPPPAFKRMGGFISHAMRIVQCALCTRSFDIFIAMPPDPSLINLCLCVGRAAPPLCNSTVSRSHTSRPLFDSSVSRLCMPCKWQLMPKFSNRPFDRKGAGHARRV